MESPSFNPTYNPSAHPSRTLYCDHATDLESAITRVLDCRPWMVGLDTETDGLHLQFGAKLLIIQVHHPLEGSIIIDCRRIPAEVVAEQLQSLLNDNRYLKIIHNAQFDLAFIENALGLKVERVYDTLLAERLLTAGTGREASLQAVIRKYIGCDLNKEVREQFASLGNADVELSPEVIEYCAEDVRYLPEVMMAQARKLADEGLLDVAYLECQVVPALVEAHLQGVQVERVRWEAHLDHLSAQAT